MDPTAIAASWRCPHCRTLQPESFQCWRCARSAVSCSSCHRFRVSVSPDLGYCASDPSRAPLRGDEVRACWEAEPRYELAPGLFAEPELRAGRGQERPMRSRSAQSSSAQSSPARTTEARRSRPKPALEEPRAAGWVERPPPGGLIDAPTVDPGEQVQPESVRRARRARPLAGGQADRG